MRKSFCASVAFATLGIAAANAATLTFTIENKSKSTVESFFASPVGTAEWEEDLLGSTVLEPGQSKVISFDDDRGVCKYDLLFAFSADSDLEDVKDTKNLCSLDHYTVYE